MFRGVGQKKPTNDDDDLNAYLNALKKQDVIKPVVRANTAARKPESSKPGIRC
jgi:hypothetical protein